MRTTQEHPGSAWNAAAAWRCLATARSRRPSRTTSSHSSTRGTGPSGWASTTCDLRACTFLTMGHGSNTSSGANTSCPASRTEGDERTVLPCRQTTATGGTTTAIGPWTISASLMTGWHYKPNCFQLSHTSLTFTSSPLHFQITYFPLKIFQRSLFKESGNFKLFPNLSRTDALMAANSNFNPSMSVCDKDWKT